MEASTYPTLIVVSLLSCRSHVRSKTGRDIPDIGGDIVSATTQQNDLNSMLCGASFFLATAFIVASNLPPSLFTLDLACESSKKLVTTTCPPKNTCLEVIDTNLQRSLLRMPEVVDLSAQFRGDVNSSIFSSSSTASDTVVLRRRKSTVMTTRRQRRAQDLTACNYSDFCDNDLSREIEAMVLEAETTYANRGTEKNESICSQPSVAMHSAVEEIDQVTSVETAPVITKDDTPTLEAKGLYVKDAHNKQVRNSMNRLRQMFNKKVGDDVPAMRLCSNMSLSSDYSFSTRSSSATLSVSPTKKTRHLSPQRNAEWAIIE